MSYFAGLARSVTRYDPADKDALRAFQAEYFGATSRQCDDRYFEWLFERNPYRDTHGPTLWLCKRDGIVVGQQASIPVILKVGAMQCRAAWGMDLMVRTEWRLRGVAPALTAAYEASADVLLGAAMSEAAHRAFLRRGWADLGLLPFFVRPLDLEACAQSAHVPTVLAKLIPRVLTSGSAYAAGRLMGGLSRSSLEPIAAFDERSEGLWSVASRDYSVLTRRDLRHLRWRFDEIPCRTGYERYYLIRAGAVLGYAVTRLEPWRGTTVARIVDYLAPRRALRALLAMVMEEMSSKRAAAVFVEHLHHGSESVLRSLGCFRAPAATRFILNARSGASPLGALLTRRDQWYVSLADSDLDHEATHTPAGPAN